MSKHRLDDAIKKLKNTGVRMTPQRHAILEYLYDTMDHPTADDIYKALEGKFPNMSVATVYNNLRMLTQAGLVKELTFGDSSSRFDAVMDDHYHVVCRECGKIVDFHHPPLKNVEEEAENSTGFVIDFHRMEFFGKCNDCHSTKVHLQ